MLEPDADGDVSLDEIIWETQRLGDGGANLRLEVTWRPEDGDELSRWSIRCTGVVSYRFDGRGNGPLEHVRDLAHPLLRPYTAPSVQLFFNTSSNESDAIVGALWHAHQETCAGWIPFDRYLRPSVIAGRHGQLADGPRWLLERYAAVMERFGTQTSMIAEGPYLEWRDGAWKPRERPPEAIHFGTCSVVADSFSAKRR